MRTVILTILLSLGLAACGTPADLSRLSMPDLSMPALFSGGVKQTVMLDDNAEFTLPGNPWAGDDNLDISQQIQARWAKDEQGTFQARIALAPGAVKIVMIDDLGRRAIDIDWDADALTIQTADWLPETFDARRLLADIVMVYWPLDALKKALPGSMSVTEILEQRVIRINATGRIYARIDRPSRDIWQGVASLRNERFGYDIAIRSQRMDP
ncbi:DUF3261 domain-containing protein [Thalassospira sp.]|uniref:DUF3261 domain-containing protein n=1 Tax=Thalassospira sp. TaxID=1912094 RepID=UPI0027328F7C|nr:DUF3261 domain-containing protein [Thalassospira sp.]MDP2698557.1 DUF3261 domain-containing protein [Thalassospira sp.]